MTAQTGLREYLSFHGPWDENFALYYKSYKDINENMWPEDKKIYRLFFRIDKVHIWRPPSQNVEPMKFMPWDYDNYIVFTVSLNIYILIFIKLTRNMYRITLDYFKTLL